jgi:putative transposase
MPHNCYYEIYLHLTWHTKQSVRLLAGDVENRAHKYIVHRIAETPGAFVHQIGGTEDHIHVAVSIPPTLLISKWIGELKGASAHHLNHNVMDRPVFAWQAGYGAVTFGQKDLPFVREYVRNQRARHAEGRIYARLERTEPEEVAEAAVREGR